MATTRSALTDEDIRTLVKGATPDERALAARKLCGSMDRPVLGDEDRKLAGDILRIMAADAAEMVRSAIVETLKASPIVPRDVALKLAKDVESVCVPLLTFSPVFTDTDLAEIVRLSEPVRQVAVARRPELSASVTEALASYGCEAAVEIACANPKAQFAEASLQQVVTRFETSEKVLAAVAYRAVLPPSVSERLIALVSDEVRAHLVTHHAVSEAAAATFAINVTELATVDLVDQVGQVADMKAFVAHVSAAGRLTASLLLRALANGHMAFFEWGISHLAGVPHHRSWLMIHDAGPLGLKAIYERAGLPSRLLPAFRAGVDTFHALEHDAADEDPATFRDRMLQRFLTQAPLISREDMDYLIERLGPSLQDEERTLLIA